MRCIYPTDRPTDRPADWPWNKLYRPTDEQTLPTHRRTNTLHRLIDEQTHFTGRPTNEITPQADRLKNKFYRSTDPRTNDPHRPSNKRISPTNATSKLMMVVLMDGCMNRKREGMIKQIPHYISNNECLQKIINIKTLSDQEVLLGGWMLSGTTSC